MAKSFLITLPSDFTSELHPNNIISNFKTEFKVPFNLSNNYECGLVEIIYPTTICNIPFDMNIVLRTERPGLDIILDKVTLKSGNYLNENEIFTEISNKMNTVTKLSIEENIKKFLYLEKDKVDIEIDMPIFQINNKYISREDGKITISINGRVKNDIPIYWKFDEYLHLLLGFQENETSRVKNAKYPIDIFGNISELYIYTNIIRESFVGNKKAQLLRVIPVDKPTDKKIIINKSISFNPILFYPLRSTTFDLIEIQIRDSTGNLIKFESGKVIITLMFKEIN